MFKQFLAILGLVVILGGLGVALRPYVRQAEPETTTDRSPVTTAPAPPPNAAILPAEPGTVPASLPASTRP